jgi:hypothetical protein
MICYGDYVTGSRQLKHICLNRLVTIFWMSWWNVLCVPDASNFLILYPATVTVVLQIHWNRTRKLCARSPHLTLTMCSTATIVSRSHSSTSHLRRSTSSNRSAPEPNVYGFGHIYEHLSSRSARRIYDLLWLGAKGDPRRIHTRPFHPNPCMQLTLPALTYKFIKHVPTHPN